MRGNVSDVMLALLAVVLLVAAVMLVRRLSKCYDEIDLCKSALQANERARKEMIGSDFQDPLSETYALVDISIDKDMKRAKMQAGIYSITAFVAATLAITSLALLVGPTLN